MTATVTPIKAARRPDSLTPDPLLLNTERLHRVDASQLPQGAGVSLGYCRTDMGVCMGHPACADTACPGHPRQRAQDPEDQDVPETERDRALLIKATVGYVAFLAACAALAVQWLSR